MAKSSTIPLLVGIVILVAIFAVIYFLSSSDKANFTPTTETAKPKKSGVASEDIVLMLLQDLRAGTTFSSEEAKASPKAIAWNAEPNSEHPYVIKLVGAPIGETPIEGKATSKTNVFRVKNVPIVYGYEYKVKVGDTEISTNFSPPIVLSKTWSGSKKDSSDEEGTHAFQAVTTSTPTNIEVLADGVAVPLNKCNLTIEPPGFLVEVPSYVGGLIIVMYNGPNSVTYLEVVSPASKD
jgi:hypothetical protein